MKKIHAFAALALLSCTAPSHAGVVGYRFTSTIDHLLEYDAKTQTVQHVEVSAMSGWRIAMGDQMTGKFSYSSDMEPDTFQAGPLESGTVEYFSNPNPWSFEFPSAGLSYGGAKSLISIWDNVFDSDMFGLFVSGADNYSAYSFSFLLNDRTGTVFSDTSAPVTLPLEALSFGSIDYSRFNMESGNEIFLSTRVTSIEKIPAITEVSSAPTTWLFIAGLPLLLTLRHRRY